MRIYVAVLISLSLTLMACNGAIPGAASAEISPHQDAEFEGGFTPEDEDLAAIRALLKTEYAYLSDQLSNGAAAPTFKAARYDLNGDGLDEILLRLEGPFFCGSGGCTLRVYQSDGSGLSQISRSTITMLPVGVLDESDKGWRAISVGVAGGGIEAGRSLLRFDGEKYPLNPSVPPAEPTELIGIALLSEKSPNYPINQ